MNIAIALVSRQRGDGSYPTVGMNDQRPISGYKTLRGLMKYGLPQDFYGLLKIEVWTSRDAFRNDEKPYKTVFHYKDKKNDNK